MALMSVPLPSVTLRYINSTWFILKLLDFNCDASPVDISIPIATVTVTVTMIPWTERREEEGRRGGSERGIVVGVISWSDCPSIWPSD